MDGFQENVARENLAAAEVEVKEASLSCQRADSGTLMGSVSKDGGLSCDGPVVDVTKTVIETDVISVEEKAKDQEMDGEEGGNEARIGVHCGSSFVKMDKIGVQENIVQEMVTLENLASGEVADSETLKVDLKERNDVLVKGFVSNDEESVEMDSVDGPATPVVFVTKNVVETQVVSVEEGQEDQEMDDVDGGKEVEEKIDSALGDDQMEEKVKDQEMNGEEGGNEARIGVHCGSSFLKMNANGVQENRVQDMVTLENRASGEVADSETLKVDLKETHDVLVEGFVSNDGESIEMDSVDGPATPVVTKNIVETQVVSVDEGQEDQEMDDVEVGKEVEEKIDSALGDEKMEENEVQDNVKPEVNAIKGEESDDSDEEDSGEQDHEFSVGDFVWGKIRSFPWWPGQIYEPSDASDFAVKCQVKGRLLVAYFGDGSFSWCRKSQLKHFAENYEEMSCQSNYKNFFNAVEEASEEFCRTVELEMNCKCMSLENHVGDSERKNDGIREGASVSKGKNLKYFLARWEPEQLLGNLMCAAKTASIASALELRILRSWLAAFYRRKGGFLLIKYHEPIPIEGMEDKMGNEVNVKTDSGEAVILPIQGPSEEDWTTSPIPTSEDKVYQRKQKSVAALMEEDMMDIELKHSKASKTKLLSDKKRSKVNYESESGGSSSVKTSQKRRGRKKKFDTVALENDEVDGEEETIKSFTSRERKKSKYLSPPYTSLIVRSSGSSRNTEADSETKVSGQLTGSSPFLTSCSNQSKKKRIKEIADVAVNEVLSFISNAASDPCFSREIKNYDKITGFISAFRKSVFADGSDMLLDFHKSKESVGTASTNPKLKEGEASVLISFPPAFVLPSKGDLIKIFDKFGEIDEAETDVFYNSFCARVAFVRSSVAEEASNVCLKKSPFGNANVNYRVVYPSAGRKASSVQKKTAENDSTGLGLIAQKLETLTLMVKSWDGQITPELKLKLEGELKDLLEKVSSEF